MFILLYHILLFNLINLSNFHDYFILLYYCFIFILLLYFLLNLINLSNSHDCFILLYYFILLISQILNSFF